MNFIQKINQFLIERYPTVWNTKLVWMLVISLTIHILSFFAGFLAYSNPVTLQGQYVTSEYFTNGTFLFHSILSVLLIVVWLYKMFQNNAFKNYYPLSRNQLFFQFIQYVIIIIVSTSFYVSYMLGVQTFINTKYPDESFNKWQETANLGLAFLPQSPEKYALSNRKFPDEFYNLYCEMDRNKIDFTQPYYEAYNQFYQYNTLKVDTIFKKNSELDDLDVFPVNMDDPSIANFEQFEKYVLVYYKDKYVNLSDKINTTKLSFYNYSSVATNADSNFYDPYMMYEPTESYLGNSTLDKSDYELNKKIYQLLSSNDKGKIEEIMTDFLKMSEKLNITSNLTIENWKPLVFNGSNDYLVTQYVSLSQTDLDYKDIETVYQNVFKEIYDKNRSSVIFASQDLLNSFSTIKSYKSLRVFSEYLSVYLWLATIASLLIFSFRVTNIRTMIFAAVSTGVLSLFFGLISIGFGLLVNHDSILFLFGFYLFVALCIFGFPIVASLNGRKNISAVLLVMGITGIPFIIFGTLRYIAEIDARVKANANDMYTYYPTFLDHYSNETISIIVFSLSLIVLYFYISVVMKWKAATE